MKASRSLRAFRRRLFARCLLAVLLYLLQSGPLLIAIEEDDRAKLSSLNKQVAELIQAGRFNEAIPIAQEAVELCEKTLRPDHPDTAAALNNLAGMYVSLGDYAKAEPLLQRALKIKEKALGPDHPSTATTLSNLADMYRSMGNYAKADPLYQRALKIREKALDRAKLSSLNKQFTELYQARRFNEAIPIAQGAVELSEKALGPDHPNTATTLSNLALLYESMGNYTQAEPLYQRALKIYEKALGPDHPDTATTLHNLARLYVYMGNYTQAEPLYQRALKIYEKALCLDHPDTAQALNDLGALYVHIGDCAKAEPLLQRALKIVEKTLGPDHPDTAPTLSNLGALYRSMGDYAKAEPLYQHALKIDEKALGPDHATTAKALNNLGTLYRSMGDYAKAEPLYQRALKIDEKALGPDHPDTATTLNNLALLKIDQGKVKDAIPLAARARQAQEKYLSNILSFTSEQQRLAFQTTTHPYTTFATLGSAAELAQTVLRQKGVVLDSLLEDRLVAEASADPKQREVIDQLRAAKQRLMQLVLEVPKDLSQAAQKQRAAEKEKLSTEVEQLESGLARQVAGLGKARRALSVTIPQVQSVLPKQAVLIELLRYYHYLGKNKFELRYGAVMITPSGESKWVALGTAEEIEKDIQIYQKLARQESPRRTIDEANLTQVLHALYTQVWVPIEQALPTGTKTVIISPDGELSFISFATLLASDDKFLGEKYSICYVASGRDLLRETKSSSGNPGTVVFANPNFNGEAATTNATRHGSNASRSLEMRDLQSISERLVPLSGTAAEAVEIKKHSKESTTVFPDLEATEANLREVKSPRVLYLATHGFFLRKLELGKSKNPLRSAAEVNAVKLVNPMYRSGLALAGARRTLQAWIRGEVPSTENDGIVTAEEVGGLKLNGTWLVVLSACDTGSGEARAGEGVMGLRRGFVQAGAQNLLMTVWPIGDQTTTVQILLDFYDAANKSGNAPQALADTQRDWLVKLRKERGLLSAVKLAGPFIMSSQGNP